jgi:pimeloyl-ACP methyl ester carboxylesterase
MSVPPPPSSPRDRRRRLRLLLVLVGGLLLLAGGAYLLFAGRAPAAVVDTATDGTETPPVVADEGLELRPDTCPVDADTGTVEVTCGWLTVPARHADPSAGSLELAVAVLHAADPTEPDPVLYLSGGPGDGALEELEAWATDPLLGTRDVVLFDQRGTGASDPDVRCPEEAEEEDAYEAERRCRARLDAEGIDLGVLRTTETAADVAVLRTALGYETWNLWGSSYGTRVALAVLRDDPTGVRSVVLEGAYPHQVDAYAEAVAGELAAIDRLAEVCADDPGCDREVGDLRDLLEELVLELDESPVELDDGAVLDGVELLWTVTAGLAESATIGAVPGWLAALAAGSTEPFELSAARRGYQDPVEDARTATFYVIECSEEVAHSALADVEPDDVWEALGITADDVLADWSAVMVAETLASCDIWDTGGSPPVEDAPVTSEVPVLVFAGLFDPRTPPTWGRVVADAIPGATLVELGHLGHDTIDADPCARGIFEDFLRDPSAALDLACADDGLLDLGG